jgi:serine/threonine-protein kinase
LDALQSANISNAEKLKAASARADIFLLERKYQEGLQAAENLPDDQVAAFPGHLSSKYYYIGFARKALRDETGAQVAFLKAKNTLQEQLKRTPDSPDIHIQLAKMLAFLGEKDSALAEAQRATELVPQSDAFGGPEIMSGVAEVYAILGENDRAIEVLERLLSRPSGVTAQVLKINPIWDPLRSDPRFQALLSKYAGKT